MARASRTSRAANVGIRWPIQFSKSQAVIASEAKNPSRSVKKEWIARFARNPTAACEIRDDRRSYQYLLLLKFGDRLDPTRFRSGKGDLIAGMYSVQRQAILYFELFGSPPGIGSDRTALCLSNRDHAIDPVNSGNRSRKRLLGQGRRTDDGEGRSTSQNDLCGFHGSPPGFGT